MLEHTDTMTPRQMSLMEPVLATDSDIHCDFANIKSNGDEG